MVFFSNLNADYNSHGVSGLINTPSARFAEEGTLSLVLNRGIPDRKYILSASPYNWLEASLFYVDIVGKEYPGGFKQSYKDKGFSAKVKILDETDYFPQLAIGLNDLAGTGFYNSEYIVLSKKFSNYDISLGMGWGNYSDGLSIQNPLIKLDDSFNSRSEVFKDFGGSFDLNNYFSGKRSAIFANLQYRIKNNLLLSFEYDPTILKSGFFDDPYYVGYEQSKIRLNTKLTHKTKKFISEIALVRGSELHFQLSYKANFSKIPTSPKYQNKINKTNNKYENLKRILEINNIGLISVQEEPSSVQLKVKHNSFPNLSIPTKYIHESVKDSISPQANNDINISHNTVGMEVARNQIRAYRTASYKNLNEPEIEFSTPNFVVIENFPYINWALNVVPRFFIAGREGFLHSALMLENDLNISFNEKIQFTTNLKYSIYDEFSRLTIPPLDSYPAQVRSDNKDYLNKFSSGIFIGRAQIDYFHSIKNNYFLFSAGIFEEMFSGAGVEYMRSVKKTKSYIGAELFFVKKRDYRMMFSHRDYENIMARFKLIQKIPKLDMVSELSYGEYLAGDNGYTFKLEREFKNGARFGVFFSQTDVPTELFGEGSFDKGITFTIPIRSLLNSEPSLTSYVWRPLTKDPAALLVRNVNLYDLLRKYDD